MVRLSKSQVEELTSYLSVNCIYLVAPPGLEPGLSALKGPRVNQLHHGAVHVQTSDYLTITTCSLDSMLFACSIAKKHVEKRFGSVTGARTRTLRLERATC
jgi:hypothetical protein